MSPIPPSCSGSGATGPQGPAGPAGPQGPPGAGDITTPQRVVTTSDSILIADRVILVQQTGPITLDLPLLAPDTTLFIIKDFDGNALTDNITITTNGGDTLDLAASFVMNVNFMSILISCDGAGRYFLI